MIAKLVLEDGSVFAGQAFGSPTSTAGEVVFNTGMVGYPESFTDPSYEGQILILTYPLIGNYGVPPLGEMDGQLVRAFESQRIHIAGLVVSEHSKNFSHWTGKTDLHSWLEDNRIPGISGVDTRWLTQKLREKGCMLGKIVVEQQDVDFIDPNLENLVARVSPSEPIEYGDGAKKVLLINCGCKLNIVRSLLKRDVTVRVVPWDWDISKEQYDGILISNGPGDPKMCETTVERVRKALEYDTPAFGICLGSQVLALAAGADTYKLKYGHRSQNQPCVLVGSKRCYITSQNHGYAVDEKSLPPDWDPWFFNANDGTNEGIRHRNKPFISVQFHPEASPGPLDTGYLFDQFIEML
ncbi:glutamine-hydrolyzing carbamoyl-phosphate synthase small subunit [candidate division KSB1 bacterium]|nr:glutamine-hydrolyzing carbamoyl-phosphate synthase small subunit [candidate division KSB1 bacterium]NIR72191.1 glutamine-hydrolyzing carbamoyl-phosphate synthase small subunit [candidate division KSB1 bacterium]NIS26656.1 glutamine-hydrolyzing carbamoyl-phosphate synthase small subunit [candidate division KSB1 bacterium]NIT73424.1 glutamine-hydrolyzing carbamoyl-phosphate synthase small subunit [candidate division KSB1 bacterium]NIU27272.1 glutamine-hydrolyzing carbamoyl-phosphate synthase s